MATSTLLPKFLSQFNDQNLQFKYGLVGDNGVGKTTLLKALHKQLGNAIYVPQQHSDIANDASLLAALNIADKVHALQRIESGEIEQSDYDYVGQDWDILAHVEQTLSPLQLWPIDLTRLFSSLSGGQKTKLLLARALLANTDIILLDEPTNNLDSHAKQLLLKYIKQTNKGFMIASHDRELLKKMDSIIEITSNHIHTYGGNFDSYQQQKTMQQNAIEQTLKTRAQQLEQSKKAIKTRMERHEKNAAHGRQKIKAQIKAKGCYDKIQLKSKQGQSQQTNKRIRNQASRKLQQLETKIQSTKRKTEALTEIDMSLAGTIINSHKIVLKIEKLSFRYPNQNKLLLNNFNLQITGPERVAITGTNGCGKSTLIKLIRQLLTPLQGSIHLGVNHIGYLDQSTGQLNPQLSLLDNYLSLNPQANRFDAHRALAIFNFRNTGANKHPQQLSSGEKIRAALAISLLSIPTPELLILDEPTNHLDLTAVEALEKALQQYQGAILAVSHDKQFLENIGIETYRSLNRP